MHLLQDIANRLSTRISDIRVSSMGAGPRTNWLFICVQTDDGREGWGEVTLRSHDALIAQFVQDVEESFLGKCLSDALAHLHAFPGLPSGRVGNTVISGIDQAIADLIGQEVGRPIWQLFATGTRVDPLGYATVNHSIHTRTPAGFAEATAAAVRTGFNGVKIMPFDAILPHTASSAEGQDEIDIAERRVAAVRDAVGPDIQLMVDCHWRLDVASALRVVDRMAAYRLKWIECPTPEGADWIEGLGTIRARANAYGILLAGAENIVGLSGAMPFLSSGAYDVIMPDIKYCGGYTEFSRISKAAAKLGVRISPHNPSGPIAHAHTLHISSALDLSEPVELQFAESSLFYDCLALPLAPLTTGRFQVPRRPGLGVSIRDEILAANPARKVPLRLHDPSFA